jgi:hypothetical protein
MKGKGLTAQTVTVHLIISRHDCRPATGTATGAGGWGWAGLVAGGAAAQRSKDEATMTITLSRRPPGKTISRHDPLGEAGTEDRTKRGCRQYCSGAAGLIR